jgi:hypothetical protein
MENRPAYPSCQWNFPIRCSLRIHVDEDFLSSLMKKPLFQPLAFFAVFAAVSGLCLVSATAGPVPDLPGAVPEKAALNVRKAGAKGDGKSLDTAAIQSVIDQCAKQGGGTVLVPAGRYLVGTLVLKCKVRLHLAEGATLLGSTRLADYTLQTPAFGSRTNGLYVKYSILYAENAEGVSVTGPGKIDGQGRDKAFSRTRPQSNRPYLARFVACRNLVIRDVSMDESANWTCHLLGCTGVRVDGLKIKNSVRANRDGLDIDSCSDVLVTNCRISSQDDAIVMKTTAPVPCRNITIRDCTVSSHASGIKMGTETTANFENIVIEDCTIHDIPALGALSVMSVDGGVVKDVRVNRIKMENVAVPLMIRLGNRARPWKHGLDTPPIGMVEDVRISNVEAKGVLFPSHITGLRQKRIAGIRLSHIGIQFKNEYKGRATAYNRVPFKVSSYPLAKLYGDNLPASAFYVRDADRLSFEDIKVSFAAKDARIPFVFDHVKDVRMEGCVAGGASSAKALVYLRNADGVRIAGCTAPEPATSLAVHEVGGCTGLDVVPGAAKPRRMALAPTPSLPDRSYDDIRGASSMAFNGAASYRDLACQALADGAREFSLQAQRGRSFRLVLLCANRNGNDAPESLKVSIDGKSQRVKVDWSAWGWAVVNYQEAVEDDEMRKIRVEAENGKDSGIVLSRVVLVPVAVTD